MCSNKERDIKLKNEGDLEKEEITLKFIKHSRPENSVSHSPGICISCAKIVGLLDDIIQNASINQYFCQQLNTPAAAFHTTSIPCPCLDSLYTGLKETKIS